MSFGPLNVEYIWRIGLIDVIIYGFPRRFFITVYEIGLDLKVNPTAFTSTMSTVYSEKNKQSEAVHVQKIP